jgi:CheY-like chemotaxis protein
MNEKLLASAKGMMGEDMNIPLGCSVGAIFIPKHGNDYTTLLKQADKCLYAVKKNGKHGYAVYSSDFITDNEEAAQETNLRAISEILSERNITDVALQLDMDAFTHVYRFANRFFLRNNINSCKVLFTISKPLGMDEAEYRNYCDDFGNQIRENLRKSDLLTRTRYNQYYVIITDIREEFVDKVLHNIMDSWEINRPISPVITYEKEYVRMDGELFVKRAAATVAVVDDDQSVIEVAKRALSDHGVTVEGFLDGESFMEYVNTVERVPECILLDVNMHGMGGFEILKAIKEIGGDIARVPVIFLTADMDDGTEKEGLQLGALDFIRKPVITEVLKVRVNHILELSVLRKRYRGKSKDLK